ncbi:hypothetical protein [Candidatus Symbiopectobacterium sp.]|uniref:hypothetical protein n=1 Tax=Candidatus Symbiopectobacterium sp. TaxID=2816440 RepID=UPI0025BD9DB3|nr:hypothetical protein [Candidatus Symbiopectobacterium sp.]
MDNENFTVWQHYHEKRQFTPIDEHAMADSLEGKKTPKSSFGVITLFSIRSDSQGRY